MIFTLIGLLNFAAVITIPFNETDISEEIDATLKCRNIPGLAVSIVRHGEILLSRGYGVIGNDRLNPVTKNTLFGIASLSKSFAATLLVKLLLENTSLTVDTPIRKLLGDKFQMPDAFRTKETTFADIMAHRTGIPPNNYMRFDINLTRETLIERLHLLPSPKQFRVKYYYNNLMYGLITRLAEIIGGQRWEDLIRKHIFQPLAMNSTTFATVVDFDSSDVAVPYERNNGQYSRVPPEFSRRWAELAGSGSVMSSADDMVKWMNFHLYKGRNMQGQQIMSPEHLAEVHKPRFLISTASDKEIRTPQFPITSSGDVYAHGFIRGFYRGFEHLSHSGSTQGYRAYLSLLPQQKIGVFIVLSGQDNNASYRVAQVMYLLDRALGVKSWLNVTTICSYPEPWKIKPQPPESPEFETNMAFQHGLREYEGTYYNSAYGHVHINYNKTALNLIMSYGWGRWQLVRLLAKNKNNAEKFYGKAMEITLLNISPIYFISKVQENVVTIVAVKVTAFEPEVPPVFEKTNSVSVAVKLYFRVLLMSIAVWLAQWVGSLAS